MEKLVNVSRETFWNFVKDNKLTETQGLIFHSSNFINEKGEVMAYRETSSWSPEEIYKIKGEENLKNFHKLKISDSLIFQFITVVQVKLIYIKVLFLDMKMNLLV